MKFLKSLILDGRIPYLAQIKSVALFLAWVAPLSVFFLYPEYEEFGEIAWYALIFVLTIKPIALILPDLRIFSALMMMRKELGIFAGMMMMGHFVGFLLEEKVAVWDLNFAYQDIYLWGILAIVLLIPVLLTSNKKAMLILKKNWKRVQRLVYPLMFFAAVHITLVGEESGIAGLLAVVVLWVLMKLKFTVSLKRWL